MTVLIGIDEADGNERLDTLGVLVLQIFRLHALVGGNHDALFPYKSRRPESDHYLFRFKRHIRVSAALCAVSHDILLRHFSILLKR